MNKHLIILAAVPLVGVLVITGLVAFGTAKPPPPMAEISTVAAAAALEAPLPPLLTYAARDGAPLAYRAYPGTDPQAVAVLVHGSTGSSAQMNLMARALSAEGMASYAPDIRSHGASGRRGDIDYVGQLEDDLADFVGVIRKAHPTAKIVLVGHSSGGGFVLRIAGTKTGRMFDRFVLLAPFLGRGAPSTRPDAGGWTAVYVPRIVGLSILNRFGVHAFDGLPALVFARMPGRPLQTWSFRLMQDFGPSGVTDSKPSRAYLADAAKAPGRIRLLAGSADESFRADRYAEAFAGLTPPMPIEIIPGVGHIGVTSDPRALPAVVAAIRRKP